MSDTQAVRDFFGDEDYGFLVQTASGSEDVWASRYGIVEMAAEMATDILKEDVAAFELVLERDEVDRLRLFDVEEFRRLALLGLAFGVDRGDGACANYLGALYYLGDVLPQDYLRAEELYELADAKGIVHAMVNLGYIYEYGRVGEPDYVRAYMQYAKAAAIARHFEALYKLGDMYARGRIGARDLQTALALWDRSLQVAKGEAAQAQPAFRIAQLIADPENVEQGLLYDPMGALRLFQLAERGLRISVARGETHYQARLDQAIQGQERMRIVLQHPDGYQYLVGLATAVRHWSTLERNAWRPGRVPPSGRQALRFGCPHLAEPAATPTNGRYPRAPSRRTNAPAHRAKSAPPSTAGIGSDASAVLGVAAFAVVFV